MTELNSHPLPDHYRERSSEWIKGWREGWDEIPNPRTRIREADYQDGYREALVLKSARGEVTSAQMSTLLQRIPVMSGANPPWPTELNEPISLAIPLMPKTPEWNRGYGDGINQRQRAIYKMSQDQLEYDEGYHSGVEWILDDGQISANAARALLGLPGVAIDADLEDTAPTNVEPEMVNHPAHYNFGEHEVVEVLHDWQLPYPLDDVVKYIARAGKKDPAKELQDLEKARFYLNFRVAKLGGDDWNPKHAK